MFGKVLSIQIIVGLFSIVSYADNTASEFINKLQENQKNYAAYSATSVFTIEINTGQNTHFAREETVIFIDDDRIDFRKHQWPNLESKDQATPLENADNRSFMWDGNSFYHYVKQKKFDGSLHIQRNDDIKFEMLSAGYEGTPLIGIFKGDQEPVYSILRQAQKISVRDKLEKTGEVECYVIDAQTDHGEYTVWIDPEHGYNIAKAKVFKKKGDIIWGKPLGWMGDTTGLAPPAQGIVPLSGYSFNMSNVRFSKIKSVWIPVEADYETILDYEWRITTVKMHHKQTHTDLSPDFKAVNAFVPDYPNETQTFVDNQQKTYFWRDGKIIPVDKEPIPIMDKPLPDFNGININLIQNQIERKMVLVCIFDYQQRPSRNCIIQLSRRAQELKEQGVDVFAIHVSKIEKDTLDEWIKENNISFPIGMIESEEEKTRLNWGVKSLPWLILTDKEHIVKAEGFSIGELEEKMEILDK